MSFELNFPKGSSLNFTDQKTATFLRSKTSRTPSKGNKALQVLWVAWHLLKMPDKYLKKTVYKEKGLVACHPAYLCLFSHCVGKNSQYPCRFHRLLPQKADKSGSKHGTRALHHVLKILQAIELGSKWQHEGYKYSSIQWPYRSGITKEC